MSVVYDKYVKKKKQEKFWYPSLSYIYNNVLLFL